MKIIRFDPVGGASGDMILSTLVGLGVDPALLERELQSVIPGEFHIRVENAESHGVSGPRVTVDVSSEHHGAEESESSEHHHSEHDHHHFHHSDHFHRSFADIRNMIEGSELAPEVKRDSVALFRAIAEAEGGVHGKDPEEVSFHEVGAVDSIVDIVGAVIGFHQLGVEAITVSPVPVGCGTVHCAHGIYPVPAPATAALLNSFHLPILLDGENAEMLTPTGAALLGWWPKVNLSSAKQMRILASANGMGHRSYQQRPNLLRALLCDVSDKDTTPSEVNDPNTEVVENLLRLDANLDDVSGEIMAHAAEVLFKLGALDVWFTPIQMKKGRPATMLSLLIRPCDRDAAIETVFRETGTFGIREEDVTRYALQRRFVRVPADGGSVRIKVGSYRGKAVHFAPEYDDCALCAKITGRTPLEIYREAVTAYLGGNLIDTADDVPSPLKD